MLHSEWLDGKKALNVVYHEDKQCMGVLGVLNDEDRELVAMIGALEQS